MSSEVEEKSYLGPAESPIQVVQKAKRLPRFSYSRDVLLSLSGLDICNKLPRGFDASILSEFEDASNTTFEPQRNLGGAYFQKRNEYGSAQSNRLESSSYYSRGSHGRWDTRSSGSSDREELNSDRDLDFGRRYLNPSRRPWQQPEHDGLLGKPSGYSGQTSAQRNRGNNSYQLSKSTEPYQPPRPYKAAPYSRSNTDSFNDETFGTSECSTQDRAEEEKRRRESFELMRREQHKSLQDKQKNIPDTHKESLDNGFSALLDKSENAQADGNKNSEDNLLSLISQRNVPRSSVQQAPASRPLVPPGFGSSIVEKKPSTTSSNTSLALEVEKSGLEDKHLTEATNGIGGISEKDANGKEGAASLGLEVPGLSSNYMSYDPSGPRENTEGWKDIIVNDSTDKKVVKVRGLEVVGHDQPTSILDKLFQSALTRNTGGLSDFIEHQGLKADDEPRSPSLSLSSKFAQFFLEEKKPAEDSLSGELHSLVSDDKSGHQVSVVIDENVFENVPSDLPSVNTETSQNFNSTENSVEVGTQEPYYPTGRPADSSDMLTCEYIEQLMLAEANVKSSTLQHSVSEPWSELDAKTERQKNHVDDHASQHLLSLLQKGTNLKDSTPLVNQNMVTSSENFCFVDVVASYAESGIRDASAEATSTVQSAENSLTLEALFGTAFMKELQSAEAPVSAQRGSTGESIITNIQHPHELQFSHNDVSGLFPSLPGRYGSHVNDGTSMSAYTPETKSSKNKEVWTGSESLQAADIQLPEEDNLITGADAMHPSNSEFFPVESEAKNELLPSNTKDNIVDQLAALNSILINDRAPLPPGVDGSHPLRGPYDQSNVEPLYQVQELYGRPSSPQLPHQQISQTRPLVQKLDPQAHINPRMKFMGPDNIHHDPHHPYPPNMVHHHSFSNPGASRFDPASHFQMLQHMQMSGHFSPPQVHDYPRGVPPSHPFNHIPRFHEMNQMNPFPLNHRQPSYGSLGMGMPGPGVGSGINHPETIESLIEMELRANSRQNHLVPGGPVPGNYGPEIDMGFRFR